mmetsp:Transcript_8733/g.26326  ORF Transcript_8733/g.26326 Transcript_8733/m.26326 type:complete len:203 (-) Transcript_8733:2864-3472(-)
MQRRLHIRLPYALEVPRAGPHFLVLVPGVRLLQISLVLVVRTHLLESIPPRLLLGLLLVVVHIHLLLWHPPQGLEIRPPVPLVRWSGERAPCLPVTRMRVGVRHLAIHWIRDVFISGDRGGRARFTGTVVNRTRLGRGLQVWGLPGLEPRRLRWRRLGRLGRYVVVDRTALAHSLAVLSDRGRLQRSLGNLRLELLGLGQSH